MSHFRNECKHGVVISQCRCPGPSVTNVIDPCPFPEHAVAPDLSPAEAATLARFGAAPAAPESYACTCGHEGLAAEWHADTCGRAEVVSRAEEALWRVEALADKWEVAANRADDAEPVTSDGLTRMILSARYLRMCAADLRAALDVQP